MNLYNGSNLNQRLNTDGNYYMQLEYHSDAMDQFVSLSYDLFITL